MNYFFVGSQEQHHDFVSKNDIISIGLPCGIILYTLGAMSSIFFIVAFKSIKKQCKKRTTSNTGEMSNTPQAQNALSTAIGPIYEDVEMNTRTNNSPLNIDLKENVAYGQHQ